MYCTNCGKEVNGKFCENCGHPVSSTSEQQNVIVRNGKSVNLDDEYAIRGKNKLALSSVLVSKLKLTYSEANTIVDTYLQTKASDDAPTFSQRLKAQTNQIKVKQEHILNSNHAIPGQSPHQPSTQVMDSVQTPLAASTRVKFYRKTWFVMLCMIFFPPLGIMLMWVFEKFKFAAVRILLTMILLPYTLILIIANSSSDSVNTSSDISSSIPSSVIEASASSQPEKSEEEKMSEEYDVSLEFINELLKVTDQIGISKEKISSITQIENWANGERYTFRYEGYLFTVYVEKDGIVSTIRSDTKDYYRDSSVLADVNNTLITSDQMIQLKIWAEDTVTSVLKAPSTAKFAGSFLNPYDGWGFDRDGDIFKVSGYVDAQNSFGAQIRSEFYLEMNWPSGSDSSITTKFIFDGKQVI